MDAQAQDRCHRIGQTRDVHIYRLISERTIEENILKKAQQKKLLDAMVIRDGQFTTDFFTQVDLRNLFGENVQSGPQSEFHITQKEFEFATRSVEDKEDIVALDRIEKELNLDLEEFDESVPPSTSNSNNPIPSESVVDSDAPPMEEEKDEVVSILPPSQDRLDTESPLPPQSSSNPSQTASLENLESQLNPIQRYALRYLQKQEDDGFQNEKTALQDEFFEREQLFEQIRTTQPEEEEKIHSEEESLFYEVGSTQNSS